MSYRSVSFRCVPCGGQEPTYFPIRCKTFFPFFFTFLDRTDLPYTHHDA
ncbi:hypothetical protein [Rubritalea tangerina]